MAASACQAADLARVEELVEQGTNRFRAEQGLGCLAPDAKLERAARALADFMARTDEYGHTADGSTATDRVRRAGYDDCLVSENIALQYSSADFDPAELARRFVEGWKGSPGHRKNMVDPDATDLAVAVTRSPHTKYYYGVQVFGRPRSRAIEFRVTNASRRGVDYRVGDRRYELHPREARVHATCGPPEVSFPAAANEEGRKIRPSGGENVVVRGDARLTVRAER